MAFRITHEWRTRDNPPAFSPGSHVLPVQLKIPRGVASSAGIGGNGLDPYVYIRGEILKHAFGVVFLGIYKRGNRLRLTGPLEWSKVTFHIDNEPLIGPHNVLSE
jgi:hypothetical protein